MMLGKPVVDAMLDDLSEDRTEAGLTIVQVGELPESASYVKQVKKTAERIRNLRLTHLQLPETIDTGDLQGALMDLGTDRTVSGYMLQLPLPEHLQERLQEVRDWISPKKDIDLQGFEQRGIFLSGKQEGQLLPPTPYAVMKMLKHYRVDVRGRIAVIIGDGQVGGLLKVMMGNDKATQIVVNECTPDLASFTRQGDIVVGASGIPDLLTGDMIKDGAVVVNVGMKFMDGKMRGDVDVESVAKRASKVTPILGGLGQVTVMALIQNALRAARKQQSGD